MKKRQFLIPALFVLIAIILAGTFYITRRILQNKDNSVVRAKVITPKSTNSNENESEESRLSSVEKETYETFVPLYATETLISTLTIDLNNDGYDDEVVLVRKVGSEFMWLIPGIYNPKDGSYLRLDQLLTPFSKTKTFSYSGMDIIGDHRTCLIYQGIGDNGNYVMSIFLCKDNGSKLILESIGDFSSDGTVFIQQTERSESYELGVTKGAPFSVWVYKSEQVEGEKTESNQSLNQIQQEYKWNPDSQHYELSQEIKVTARRLAAKELSRIQDGTVETFADFLDGLWYKVSNEDGNIRYVFFDYASKEIIQFIGDVQEVYEWQNSKIRHNGMYLTTVNADIMNLHRRFDVALVNVDEIKITLRDDINLNISQSSAWDGSYKKMNVQSSFNTNENSDLEIYKKEVLNGDVWTSIDDTFSVSFSDLTYKLQKGEFSETGIYSISKIGEYIVLQLRSDLENSIFQEYYSLNFGSKEITETVKRKTVQRTVTDYNNLTLTPVKITPIDCFVVEGRLYTLTR